MAAMTGDRDRVSALAAARADLGDAARDWLDRALVNLLRGGPAPGDRS
jgi:hypothetical protein